MHGFTAVHKFTHEQQLCCRAVGGCLSDLMIWDLLLSYWMIEQHTQTHTYAILLMRD